MYELHTRTQGRSAPRPWTAHLGVSTPAVSDVRVPSPLKKKTETRDGKQLWHANDTGPPPP